jgi:MoxR-like ATPase
VLADEINRATPKTQSALLEAMQEQTVTVGNVAHQVPSPFFVLATQNPIELEGTYSLPEAELDRFFFKLNVGFPSRREMNEIVRRTTGPDEPKAEVVADAEQILELQRFVREVPVASHVGDYAVRLVLGTHPELQEGVDAAKRFARYGASPRAAQTMILAAKINAVLAGRLNASFEDVRRVAAPALRHRVILNYDAEAKGITTDGLVHDVLLAVPEDA